MVRNRRIACFVDAGADRWGQCFAALSRQRNCEISWRRSSNVSIFISTVADPPKRGMTGVHAGRSSFADSAPVESSTELSTQRESGLANQRSTGRSKETSGLPEILNFPSASLCTVETSRPEEKSLTLIPSSAFPEE